MLRILVYRVMMRLLVLGLLASVGVGLTSAAAGQLPPFGRPRVQHGPPDLEARVSGEPAVISPGMSAVFTLTVYNHITPVPTSRPGLSLLSGSDVQGVEVVIALTSILRQGGNIIAGGGFQCSPKLNNQYLSCLNGSIPVGQSIDIVIEVVMLGTECGFLQGVLVYVDPPFYPPSGSGAAPPPPLPFGRISEVSETNNEASATISISNCVQ